MHFGKIVQQTAENSKITPAELAWLMNKPLAEVIVLLEEEEWTSGNIKKASEALNHDFGTYLNRSVEYDFLKGIENVAYHDLTINVKYPVGRENIFEAWVERMWLMAQNLGLESER